MKYVVDEAFVKNAEACAQGVEELRAASGDLSGTAALVADTLIQQGLLDGTMKAAAVARLTDPREALLALNKIAQQFSEQEKVAAANVRVPKLGKQAGSAAPRKETSDEALFRGLGLRS